MRRQDQISEAIVELAEGRKSDLSEEIGRDSALAARLESMRALVSHLKSGFFDAPDGLRRRVIELVPIQTAVRLSTSRVAMGLRSTSESWQSLYELSEGRVRLGFSRVSTGWDVRGESEIGGTFEIAGQSLDVDEGGRFQAILREVPEDAIFVAGGQTWHLKLD
jgi:hypothetical protein